MTQTPGNSRTSSGDSFRAAVVQAASIAFDPERSIDRVAEFTQRAAAEGCQLVVFPEAFVSGYPKLTTFGVVVGERYPEGREWYRRYYEGSIEIPGPELDRLGDVARSASVHLVVGVTERAAGTLYCTIVFLGPDGELLGKHRKLVPTAGERFIWGYGDGSTLTVLPTPLGRIGGAICWENYMPQLRLALYSQGIEIYCIPTADSRETWPPTMRHIAFEGRCFVLSACQFTRRSDYPVDFPSDATDPEQVVMAGGSCIVDPFGQVLAGPLRDGEGILTADLDLDQIVRGKFDLDVVGHYGRPDIFELLVNTTARSAVTSGAGEQDRSHHLINAVDSQSEDHQDPGSS